MTEVNKASDICDPPPFKDTTDSCIPEDVPLYPFVFVLPPPRAHLTECFFSVLLMNFNDLRNRKVLPSFSLAGNEILLVTTTAFTVYGR